MLAMLTPREYWEPIIALVRSKCKILIYLRATRALTLYIYAYVQREILDPAVKGTVNVSKVCSTLKVHKIVVMSSNVAVTSNPNWPQDRLKDESCWSDKEFCKENGVFINASCHINKRTSQCTSHSLVDGDVCLFHLLAPLSVL